MAHQILDEIDQSMNLSFMNRSLEEKFMRLADLEVIDQSIYMGNNVDQNKMIKERKKYSLPKVKARNFLMGISYKRLANKDLANKPFITDCFDEKNLELMKISFEKYYVTPNYYLRNSKYGIQHRVFSELVFRDYLEKINLKNLEEKK